MSELLPVVSPLTQAHRQAQSDVDRWRGACVRHYARLEQALAAVIARKFPGSVAPGHGLGGRLNQIEKVLDLKVDSHRALHQSLDGFDQTVRAAVVHGDGTVYLDPDGNWLWDSGYRHGTAPEPTLKIFRQNEADEFERKLRIKVKKLCRLIDKLDPPKPLPTPN